jgi:hypothetical protein
LRRGEGFLVGFFFSRLVNLLGGLEGMRTDREEDEEEDSEITEEDIRACLADAADRERRLTVAAS